MNFKKLHGSGKMNLHGRTTSDKIYTLYYLVVVRSIELFSDSVPVVFEESTWSEVITTHFIFVLVVLVVTGQLIWLVRNYNRTAKPFVLPDVVHYTGVSTTAYFKPPTDPIPLIFWSATAAILSVYTSNLAPIRL